MPDRPLARPRPPSSIASPCVRNCCLDGEDICLGCFRSLNDITAWGSATDAERRAILWRAEQRKQQTSR